VTSCAILKAVLLEQSSVRCGRDGSKREGMVAFSVVGTYCVYFVALSRLGFIVDLWVLDLSVFPETLSNQEGVWFPCDLSC
jgi:hypothetical protein